MKVKRLCSIPGCGRRIESRETGFCKSHHNRWKRHGDPLAGRIRTSGSDEERYWAHVVKLGPDVCWPWNGGHVKGHGRFSIKDHPGISAHRFGYQLAYGPIPDELDVDHQCHNLDLTCDGGGNCPHRGCQNPAHLRAVPAKLNSEGGRSGLPSHKQALLRSTCKNGHPYTDETPRRKKDGARICAECQRAAGRAYYWRNREQLNAKRRRS